jgi:hypothetical protein
MPCGSYCIKEQASDLFILTRNTFVRTNTQELRKNSSTDGLPLYREKIKMLSSSARRCPLLPTTALSNTLKISLSSSGQDGDGVFQR